MYCVDSDVRLINCTVADNSAGVRGGGLYVQNSVLTLTNSILWGNAPSQIVAAGASGSWVSYSAVAGDWPGEDNVVADPLFARTGYWMTDGNPAMRVGPDDPDARWIMGDYHLQSQAGRWDPQAQAWVADTATSPCIDGGDPNEPLEWEPQPNGNVINMGAYLSLIHI